MLPLTRTKHSGFIQIDLGSTILHL